jgi:predicted PurR-regulated permease PerM
LVIVGPEGAGGFTSLRAREDSALYNVPEAALMAQATQRERVGTVMFYAVLLLLGYLVYRVFGPFLVPLGWAGVLVVIFYPLHARLEKCWGATCAAAASTLGVTLILIVPGILLTTAFVKESVDAARGLQQGIAEGEFPWIHRAWEWVQQQAPPGETTDLPTLARQTAERMAGTLAAQAGAVLKNVAIFLFDLVVVIFAMFYLFRDASRIVDAIRRVLPFDPGPRERMLAQARDLIFASVTSGLIVAVVQGTLGGIAFAVVGLGAPVFWGVVVGFFSLLPVVGAWVVWAPAAVWLLLTGELTRGIILAVIGAGLVGTVDNFLRPALISGRSQLNGLLIFISLIGGIGVFGMLGVVLGPIVVATAASVLETYTHAELTVPPKPETVGRGSPPVLE